VPQQNQQVSDPQVYMPDSNEEEERVSVFVGGKPFIMKAKRQKSHYNHSFVDFDSINIC
jgi:hypothetical protein